MRTEHAVESRAIPRVRRRAPAARARPARAHSTRAAANDRGLGLRHGQRDAAAGRALAAGAQSSASTVRRPCSRKRARRRPMCRAARSSRPTLRSGSPMRRSISSTATRRCTGFPTTPRCSRASRRMVAPEGVLAVQMPDNFRAPSHTLISDIARSDRWRAPAGRHRARAAGCGAGGLFRVACAVDGEGRHLAHRIPAGAGTRARTASIRSPHGPRARGSSRSWRRSAKRTARSSCANTWTGCRPPIRRGTTGARCFHSGGSSSWPRGRPEPVRPPDQFAGRSPPE